ncbi:MAG TPA: lipase [Firmicutes bacterium]|nr:lipase [Bacillota bacterium]
MYKCYVAIGDSLTEGFGDVIEGFEKSPWPDLLSHSLGIVDFYNLGKSGYRTDEILKELLPQALALKPDLVSITAGGNDMIQLKWSKKQYEQRMRYMIETLTSQGASVMTCTLPFFTKHVKAPLYKKIIGNFWLKQCNTVISNLATQYQTIHIDFANHQCALDLTNWSSDCIHPNSKGYAEIANAYHELIHQHSNRL